jgi:very-short-patch-repair endonuclease
MRDKSRSADEMVARIASGQHGVVTAQQLLAAGLSRNGVNRRVQKGRLHRIFRGVYGVGHPVATLEARYMAAVLANGDGAALSGHAAIRLYGLARGSLPRPEVTAPRHCRIPGVTSHRSFLDPRDLSEHRGIPITTIPRTLVDVAGDLPLIGLSEICHRAEIRYRVKGDAVLAALGRRPNSAGASKLRKIYEGDFRTTLSHLERAFLSLLKRHGVPLPQTNRKVDGRWVDCRWPERRLTVELDGFTYHHSRHAWEQDRRREREARARGEEFRRYTYNDVVESPELLLRELRALLGGPATLG